jgi:hypothetical protein
MSQIWDWLKDIDRRQAATREDKQFGAVLRHERRCTRRLRVSIPIFVYGHSVNREPFYEASELQSVNALGGLITLRAAVAPGQKLLVTTQDSERDVTCQVIGMRSASNRFAVGIAFEDLMPNVWASKTSG